MTALTVTDKQRVRFHLAYSAAVPDGDRALLEDRMENLDSPVWASQIRARLDRCDRTLAESETDAQSTGLRDRRVILGDVNRTDVSYSALTLKERAKAYLGETNQLALEIGAPNYRDPAWWGNLHMRSTIGSIPTVPAPWAAGNLYISYA
jgi:hypothetical protein